jgi:hypothetical protein
VSVILRPCTLLHGWQARRRLRASGTEITALTSVAGGALVPALSVSDTAIAPAPPAVLVMSAAEIAGDSTTGVSGILLPNASWPEAFLSPSDVVRVALLIQNDLGQVQIESGNVKQNCNRACQLTWLLT